MNFNNKCKKNSSLFKFLNTFQYYEAKKALSFLYKFLAGSNLSREDSRKLSAHQMLEIIDLSSKCMANGYFEGKLRGRSWNSNKPISHM